MNNSKRIILIAATTIFFVVIIDRFSKIFFSRILSVGESIPIIRNFFHFTLVHNTGIAFGFFRNYGSFFILVSFLAILSFSFYLYHHRHSPDLRSIEALAFSFIIAGALGNLIDRFFFGHVIDFIDFRIWPVFNVADSAITVGTVILLVKCIPFYSK